jgi:hypothetical protein
MKSMSEKISTSFDSRELVVNQLGIITDRIATDLVYNFKIGTYTIRRVDGYYSIHQAGECLYADIAFFVIAYSIVKCMLGGRSEEIRRMIETEQKFTKKYNDMQVYLNTKKWELYETSKLDALDQLWKIKNIIKQNF